MIRLGSVIAQFETDFLTQFRHRLSFDQLRALAAMRDCRSPASPMMQLQCEGCDHQKLVPHSCGHRLCPHCQHHESQQWLERQMQRQVPADYFLLTFTLPAELRGLAAAHADVVFDCLMRCAWETVRRFSQNDRQLQGTPGAIAVLHTHTRRLDFHPHVHLVVPAAAIDAREAALATQAARQERRLSVQREGDGQGLPGEDAGGDRGGRLCAAGVLSREWVAHCQSVGSGEKALIYLGRYLYRGVIREQDILACENGRVSFRYRNAKTGKSEKRSLPVQISSG
jgi:hypothetical protein